jgi:hypothetical protein
VLTATWLFLLTEEAMWSIATLLLTIAAVRRVLQHR